jgi:DinB superfamily
MNLDRFMAQMTNNAAAIHSLMEGVSSEQACWRPNGDSWSIVEVVNHLYDIEREDFRPHLDCILHHPDQPWHSIDPGSWVSERHYNERGLTPSVNGFLHEREQSLAWLKGMAAPNWSAAYNAPFGRITAGDMFAAWVAHDLLHMRQLIELHWAHTVRALLPYGVRYAGEW